MPIPINPDLIKNYVNYATRVATAGINGNQLDLKTGEKCVPMQFGFGAVKIWKVDLSLVMNTYNLTQLRGLYIDATQSAHDAIIYFPDTGYQIDVKAGYSAMVPAIDRRYSYVFYVMLAGQINDAIDKINIIATNVMIDNFNTFNLFARNNDDYIYAANANNTFISPSFAVNGTRLIFQSKNPTQWRLKQLTLPVFLHGANPSLPADKYLKMRLQIKESSTGAIFIEQFLQCDGSKVVSGTTYNYFFLKYDNINYSGNLPPHSGLGVVDLITIEFVKIEGTIAGNPTTGFALTGIFNFDRTPIPSH